MMRLTRGVLGLFTLLVIVVCALVAIAKKQAIADWWELRGYTPPAAVVSLADQTTMTPSARRIFYVNHPQVISDITVFRQTCDFHEQTIVLGCYHSSQQGIEIYDVTDPRLNGVEQVTAAHEMLHAAYDRLSTEERRTIDAQLVDFYEKHLNDQRIHQTIDLYKKTEPNDVVNEMHSILGTEVGNLSQELESYYKRYFFSRAVVAGLAAGYQQEFTSRKAQIDAYDQQLAEMRKKIEAEEQSLAAQQRSLAADRDDVERSNSAAAIQRYNARVATYNSGVRRLQQEIAQFNDLVEKRNSLAAELRGLQSSIDTRLKVQTAQ